MSYIIWYSAEVVDQKKLNSWFIVEVQWRNEYIYWSTVLKYKSELLVPLFHYISEGCNFYSTTLISQFKLHFIFASKTYQELIKYGVVFFYKLTYPTVYTSRAEMISRLTENSFSNNSNFLYFFFSWSNVSFFKINFEVLDCWSDRTGIVAGSLILTIDKLREKIIKESSTNMCSSSNN